MCCAPQSALRQSFNSSSPSSTQLNTGPMTHPCPYPRLRHSPAIHPVNYGWLRISRRQSLVLDMLTHPRVTLSPIYIMLHASKQTNRQQDRRGRRRQAPSAPAVLLPLLLAAAAALMLAPRPSSAVDPVSTYCAKNFTGAQTQASISAVLAALVPRASATYYATATSGSGSSTIWGLAQCRGDIPSSDCPRCVAAAARQVAASCRGQADARVWYDYCFLRYDDADFLGLPDTGYTLILINTMNATGDLAAFDRAERKLMARVAEEAGDPASNGLARETAKFGSEGTTIYGLGWCTRDITAADCGLCVAQAVAELPNYCRFRRGCRVLYSSCMARYETYPFFFPVTGADDDNVAAASSHAGEYETLILNHK